MVQNADSADDLASNTCLLEAVDIGRVTDDERSAGRFFTASHSDSASRLKENFINVSVEHVSAAMDSAKA